MNSSPNKGLYYMLCALPMIVLVIVAVIFKAGVAAAFDNNPHPQINYAVIVLMIIGSGIILMEVARNTGDGQRFSDFMAAYRGRQDPAALSNYGASLGGDLGTSVLVRLGLLSGGGSSEQKGSVERSFDEYEKRLESGHDLPGYLGGLMIALGLLGTFIGLLATLADISKLIAGMVGGDTSDPAKMVTSLVQSLQAPMQGMGVAFSASLFGLLGSIVLGFAMIGLKKCTREIVKTMKAQLAEVLDGAGEGHVEEAVSAPAQAGYAIEMPDFAPLIEQLADKMTAAQGEALNTAIDKLGDKIATIARVDYSHAFERLAESLRMAGTAEFASALHRFADSLNSTQKTVDVVLQTTQTMQSVVDRTTDTMKQIHLQLNEELAAARAERMAFMQDTSVKTLLEQQLQETRRLQLAQEEMVTAMASYAQAQHASSELVGREIANVAASNGQVYQAQALSADELVKMRGAVERLVSSLDGDLSKGIRSLDTRMALSNDLAARVGNEMGAIGALVEVNQQMRAALQEMTQRIAQMLGQLQGQIAQMAQINQAQVNQFRQPQQAVPVASVPVAAARPPAVPVSAAPPSNPNPFMPPNGQGTRQ